MSTKIEKLTPEQEALFPKYVEKWVAIGTNTDRLDYDTCVPIINNFRLMIQMKTAPLIIVENPIEAWVACCLHEVGVSNEELLDEMRLVFHGNPKNRVIPKAEMAYQSGSFFANVFSFYDYMIRELKIPLEPQLKARYDVWEATKDVGCIYPLSDLTILTQKPIEIHTIELRGSRVLHKDGGPALSYSGEGDFKIYSLNGVMVPEYLAVTPEENLELDLYNQEKNADVKAEFVRKVGIERFKDRGRLVDSYKNYSKSSHGWWYKSEYELWEMESLFEGLSSAPYLSMKNQTVDIYHFEAVSPECTTLQKAILERFDGHDFVIEAIA